MIKYMLCALLFLAGDAIAMALEEVSGEQLEEHSESEVANDVTKFLKQSCSNFAINELLKESIEKIDSALQEKNLSRYVKFNVVADMAFTELGTKMLFPNHISSHKLKNVQWIQEYLSYFGGTDVANKDWIGSQFAQAALLYHQAKGIKMLKYKDLINKADQNHKISQLTQELEDIQTGLNS